MPNRTVTGYIEHVDGTPWADGVVTFELLRDFATLTEVFPREKHTVTLDAAGTFTISLGVPDDPATAYYLVTLPDKQAYRMYVGDGSPVALHTLLLTATSYVDPASLQALLDEYSKITITHETADYVIVATDKYIRCIGTFTVTLPAATGSGEVYFIFNAGVGTITPVVNGSDTVNGTTPLTIPTMTHAWYIDAVAGNWDSNW